MIDRPPLEKVVEALRAYGRNPKQQPNGRGWTAQCPAHDDRKPSLSIAEGEDGRVLLKCFACCTTNSICDALGLRVAELFSDAASSSAKPHQTRLDNGKPKGKVYPTTRDAVLAIDVMMKKEHGRQVSQWLYHDAHGDLVGLVVRYGLLTPEGEKQVKTFRPVARHGDHWVIGGMPEPRPLYRLTELAAADRVYIVEGEKVADKACSIGLRATTSAHGSNTPPDKTDWSPLSDKECVILPDNDNDGAGRKYADAVAAHLSKLTPPVVVKVLELPDLPDKGDLVDWIDAHGDAANSDELRLQVEALADEAKPFKIRAAPKDPSPASKPTSGGSKTISVEPVMVSMADVTPEPVR